MFEELKSKKFDVILADPPWEYKAWPSKKWGVTFTHHYKSMKLEDVKNLPVQSLCKENCVLFLWTTCPNIPNALEVIKAWGFTYKTIAFVWIKQNKKNNNLFMGCGHYTRANAELCLLAIKGRPKKLSSAVHQVIISHRREHSRKPDEQYSKIEQLFGGYKLELFARYKREGWDNWGIDIKE